MENMEVLLRGLVMQSSGVGMGFVSFQGMEVLWVVVVATIVLALVSMTRVSVVSVGWTWGSKPGQVRVRVQSFSSLLEDGIVTASGMFSAEILNCSADSCSEDASSEDSGCASEAAEMVFIFEKKKATSLVATTLPKQQSTPVRATAPEKIVRKRSKSLDFLKGDAPLLSSLKPIEGPIFFPRREGIGWDASPGSISSCNVDSQSLANPSLPAVPALPSRIVKTTSSGEWDPLLKLKIRDAVVNDGGSSFSVKDFTFPLVPVSIQDSRIAALKDYVVRVWDSDTKCLTKSVRLPSGGNDVVTAFDVNCESNAVAMARKDGLVSIANLETAAHANCYKTQHPVVQAIHLDRNLFSKTMFTGGPAAANPGCSVALYDSRSSRRELALNLTSASAIYGISSQGEELLVRDETLSVAVHDMRMLGASTLTRVSCEMKLSSAPEDRWWEIDTTFEEEDDADDDDFMNRQTLEEIKPATSMSTLVTVMSRSFSSKALIQ